MLYAAGYLGLFPIIKKSLDERMPVCAALPDGTFAPHMRSLRVAPAMC
jgi:hypothetical protein